MMATPGPRSVGQAPAGALQAIRSFLSRRLQAPAQLNAAQVHLCTGVIMLQNFVIQEAQLPQRNSASAAHIEGGG